MYPAAILTIIRRNPPSSPSPAFAAVFFSALLLAFLMLAAFLVASTPALAQSAATPQPPPWPAPQHQTPKSPLTKSFLVLFFKKNRFLPYYFFLNISLPPPSPV